MSVKRIDIRGDGSWNSSPTGAWVSSREYDALASQCELRDEQIEIYEARIVRADAILAIVKKHADEAADDGVELDGDAKIMMIELARYYKNFIAIPTPPYPWCRQPSVCRGTCPMDPNCGE